jgi:hypothetical protein
LQQEVHVVGLGDPALGLGAQHRRQALLGERTSDDLGERGEDRVLQLGQHKSDQPGPLASELGGPLVPEHVQSRHYGLPCCRGDTGFAVEDAADRRLADPDLLRDLGKSSRHARKNSANTASGLRPPGIRVLFSLVGAKAPP